MKSTRQTSVVLLLVLLMLMPLQHIKSQEKNDKSRSATRELISGVVISQEDNEPVIGATLRIEGTDYGTTTDLDGKFVFKDLKPAANQKLVVSYVGMVTQVLQPASNMKIILVPNAQQLEEVVVTGVFKKAKESYTGAVTTISAEKLQAFAGQNLLQTLRLIDPSINFAINNAAGSNPNNLPQINIRGNSSLPMNVKEFNESLRNDVNSPLIIMDGFEISLQKLMDYNDEEIESINVLKDASATAIYGSRGSNGVIVVITKQPEAGKLKVYAEFGTTIEAPDLTSYRLLDAAGKLELERKVGLYDSDYPGYDIDYKDAYNKRLTSVLSGVNTNWLSKPLQVGVGTRYNVRLEGGSNEFRWGATVDYKNTQGAMKTSERKNLNAAITLMYQFKSLLFKNNTAYTVNRAEESKYGLFSTYASQQPYNAPYDVNGKLIRSFDGFYLSDAKVQNPLYDASLNLFNKSGYQELINNFSIEWNLHKDLTLRGQFGISVNDRTSDNFLPAEHSRFMNNSNYDGEGFFRRGSYRYGLGRTINYSGDLTLSYSKIFDTKHLLYFGANYQIAESDSQSIYIDAEGFTSEDMNFLGNARQYLKDGKPSGTKNKTRRLGLTGNANYTYDSRYYVDVSFRVDGNSTFGSERKFAPFWSAGIGWNLHREKFLSNKTPIHTLRLKTSYGQTGSLQGSYSGALTLYKYMSTNKYMNWIGAMLQGWGNPKLTWQKTDEFNLGVEWGIWNGRLKGEFNVYTKNTSNLRSYVDTPRSTGFSEYTANIGTVKNSGFELSLSTFVIRNTEQRFSMMLNGQLMYNKNTITKLSEAIKTQNEVYSRQNVDVSTLFYEGRPQHSIYAVRSLGIDPSTGEEIFLDKNDKVTNKWKPSDKVFLGSSEPLYRGNMGTMLMWKDLILNISFGYYWGGKTYNSTLLEKVEVTTSTLKYQNVDERVLSKRWHNPGDVTFFKGFSDERTRATSRFVMDDAALQLQLISLQYKWDTEWLKRHTRLNSVTFAINMSDIAHFSTIRMERGTDYPYARNIQGSVRLLF